MEGIIFLKKNKKNKKEGGHDLFYCSYKQAGFRWSF